MRKIVSYVSYFAKLNISIRNETAKSNTKHCYLKTNCRLLKAGAFSCLWWVGVCGECNVVNVCSVSVLGEWVCGLSVCMCVECVWWVSVCGEWAIVWRVCENVVSVWVCEYVVSVWWVYECLARVCVCGECVCGDWMCLGRGVCVCAVSVCGDCVWWV